MIDMSVIVAHGRLAEAADLADIAAAQAARAEVAERGTVSWCEVKADLGLA